MGMKILMIVVAEIIALLIVMISVAIHPLFALIIFGFVMLYNLKILLSK